MQLANIETKIYEIRGLKVMLDFDLAELYEVETRALNQAVKRNIKRFPDDFMFQLNKAEWGYFAITICDIKNRKKRRDAKAPLCFYGARRVNAQRYSYLRQGN